MKKKPRKNADLSAAWRHIRIARRHLHQFKLPKYKRVKVGGAFLKLADAHLRNALLDLFDLRVMLEG